MSFYALVFHCTQAYRVELLAICREYGNFGVTSGLPVTRDRRGITSEKPTLSFPLHQWQDLFSIYGWALDPFNGVYRQDFLLPVQFETEFAQDCEDGR